MPRLSIIIPFSGTIPQLEETLVSVLQNRPVRTEVIVVHSGEYPDPYRLTDEVRFVQSPPGASLIERINLGVDAAQSEWIHLMQCGATVAEGWTEPAFAHFDEEPVASVAATIRRGKGTTTCGVAPSPSGGKIDVRRGEACGPSLSAGFYRKSALDDVGGFDPVVGPELADVDVGLALAEVGYAARRADGCVIAFEAQQSSVGESESSFASGRSRERLFWRHVGQNESLSMTARVFAWGAEAVAGLFWPPRWLSLLGRIAASREGKKYAMYRQWLAEAVGPESAPCEVHPFARRTEETPLRKAA